MRPDGEERGGLRRSASYTALPCSEPPSNPPALGHGGRRGQPRATSGTIAGAVGEGATPCTDGRPSETTPAWIASHQSSLPNAAKGYPPREPREQVEIHWWGTSSDDTDWATSFAGLAVSFIGTADGIADPRSASPRTLGRRI